MRTMHPLRKFLTDKKSQDKKFTLKRFAARIPTSPVYLMHIMAGRAQPSLKLASRLVAECEGQVAFEDFLPPKDKFVSQVTE